jgi:hypothetical protein
MNNYAGGLGEAPVKDSIRVVTEKQLAEILQAVVFIRNESLELRNSLVGPAPLIPENEKQETAPSQSLLHMIQGRHREIIDMLHKTGGILEGLKKEIG